MNNKVGIVTLHAITNYGGILQCYALQTILERMGYDVEKIERRRWRKPLSRLQKLFIYPFRIFKKKVLKQPCVIKLEEHQYEKAMLQYDRAKYTMPFIDKYIHRRQVFSYSELKANDYLALVVGSDQIWRPQYARNANADIRDAYLNFAKDWDVKRLAYAASFGTDECEYTEKEKNDCSVLLKKFDAVSVRETSGITLCELMGRNDVCQVIDPTLHLDKDDYIKLIPKDYPLSKGDLMCYVLDKSEDACAIIDYIAEKNRLTPFEVIALSDTESNEEGFYQPPVEKWLKGFVDAKFVVTDSFHACVFSILFGKPFVVLANLERGVARYQTLLKMFGLENRLIYHFDAKAINVILQSEFKPNMRNLEEERGRAKEYLNKGLGINK